MGFDFVCPGNIGLHIVPSALATYNNLQYDNVKLKRGEVCAEAATQALNVICVHCLPLHVSSRPSSLFPPKISCADPLFPPKTTNTDTYVKSWTESQDTLYVKPHGDGQGEDDHASAGTCQSMDGPRFSYYTNNIGESEARSAHRKAHVNTGTHVRDFDTQFDHYISRMRENQARIARQRHVEEPCGASSIPPQKSITRNHHVHVSENSAWWMHHVGQGLALRGGGRDTAKFYDSESGTRSYTQTHCCDSESGTRSPTERGAIGSCTQSSQSRSARRPSEGRGTAEHGYSESGSTKAEHDYSESDTRAEHDYPESDTRANTGSNPMRSAVCMHDVSRQWRTKHTRTAASQADLLRLAYAQSPFLLGSLFIRPSIFQNFAKLFAVRGSHNHTSILDTREGNMRTSRSCADTKAAQISPHFARLFKAGLRFRTRTSKGAVTERRREMRSCSVIELNDAARCCSDAKNDYGSAQDRLLAHYSRGLASFLRSGCVNASLLSEDMLTSSSCRVSCDWRVGTLRGGGAEASFLEETWSSLCYESFDSRVGALRGGRADASSFLENPSLLGKNIPRYGKGGPVVYSGKAGVPGDAHMIQEPDRTQTQKIGSVASSDVSRMMQKSRTQTQTHVSRSGEHSFESESVCDRGRRESNPGPADQRTQKIMQNVCLVNQTLKHEDGLRPIQETLYTTSCTRDEAGRLLSSGASTASAKDFFTRNPPPENNFDAKSVNSTLFSGEDRADEASSPTDITRGDLAPYSRDVGVVNTSAPNKKRPMKRVHDDASHGSVMDGRGRVRAQSRSPNNVPRKMPYAPERGIGEGQARGIDETTRGMGEGQARGIDETTRGMGEGDRSRPRGRQTPSSSLIRKISCVSEAGMEDGDRSRSREQLSQSAHDLVRRTPCATEGSSEERSSWGALWDEDAYMREGMFDSQLQLQVHDQVMYVWRQCCIYTYVHTHITV